MKSKDFLYTAGVVGGATLLSGTALCFIYRFAIARGTERIEESVRTEEDIKIKKYT